MRRVMAAYRAILGALCVVLFLGIPGGANAVGGGGPADVYPFLPGLRRLQMFGQAVVAIQVKYSGQIPGHYDEITWQSVVDPGWYGWAAAANLPDPSVFSGEYSVRIFRDGGYLTEFLVSSALGDGYFGQWNRPARNGDVYYSPAVTGQHTYRMDVYFPKVTSAGLVRPGVGSIDQFGAYQSAGPHTFTGNTVSVNHPASFPSGTPACGGVAPPVNEICGDGVDNNGNGQVDENCQPQTITVNSINSSCSGSNPQVSLNWSSSVTKREQRLVSNSDISFGEAFENIKQQKAALALADPNIPPPPSPTPPSQGPINYSILRDGQIIGTTTQTNFVDSSPLQGSHSYSISAISSNFTVIQSQAQSVSTADCGQPPPPPGVINIQMQITGPTTVQLGQTYTYTAQVTDSATGQVVTVPAGAIQWSLFRELRLDQWPILLRIQGRVFCRLHQIAIKLRPRIA